MITLKPYNWSIIILIIVVLLSGGCKEPKDTQITTQGRNYYSVVPFFKDFYNNLSEFHTLDKRKVNPNYSVILVRGTVPSSKVNRKLDVEQGFKQESFGIFIIDNLSNNHYMTVDIFATRRFFDYSVTMEEVGEHYLIISRKGATYGDQYDKVKYFYKLEEKKVLNKISYQGMNIYSMIEFEKSLYFLGTDNNKTTIITRLKSPQNNHNLNSYEIIDEINGEKISLIRSVRIEGNKLILTSESNEYIFAKGNWKITKNPEPDLFKYNPGSGKILGLPFLRFWAPLFKVNENLLLINNEPILNRRFLIWNSKISANSYGGEKSSGIYEMTDDEYKFFRFPNPDYELFKKYRPRRVSNGYTKDHTTIEVEIGPFRLVDEQLWFGTRFYDGEGHTGVGGIGYFDVETTKYHVTYYKEIADWSSSAIYVNKQHIWLGLVGHPEGRPYPGGLVRYNRKDGTIGKYAIPKIINVIYKFGNDLYLGTSEGIYILSNEKIKYIGFSFDINHKYSLYF